jgi:hypothetical protein
MIRALQQRLASLKKDMQAINATAVDAAGTPRDLTAEESAQFAALKAQVTTTQPRSTARSRPAPKTSPPLSSRPRPARGHAGRRTRPHHARPDRRELDAQGGSMAWAISCRAVIQASDRWPHGPAPALDGTGRARRRADHVRQRIVRHRRRVPDPAAVQPEVFTLMLGDDSLLNMTDNVDVDGNGMVFPKDETTPWGTDGVRAYWQAEALAGTQTKPKLGTSTMRLHKLMALVPLTDELVNDAPALGSYIQPLMARSIRWKVNEAILFGTGAGQPRGMFSSGAAVVQNKDSGQATNTLTLTNLTNISARLMPGAGPVVWFVTPDACRTSTA